MLSLIKLDPMRAWVANGLGEDYDRSQTQSSMLIGWSLKP